MNHALHELRNQLAVVRANVEAFRDGVFLPTPERCTAVLHALSDASTLLEQLVRPSEGDTSSLPTELRRVNICAVITKTLLALEANAHERQITLRVQRCSHQRTACQRFMADPVRIAEILQNVVMNAIRYTPVGGSIEIDCRRNSGELVLSVLDSGPGVTNDEISSIFEAGFRGSAAHNVAGSGVGLALAKQFVEAQGGRIEVNTQPNQGAEFTIHLPGTLLA